MAGMGPLMPAYCKSLSLRVCKVLDDIGATEEMRRLSMETAVINEILLTYLPTHLFGANLSCYIFGSSSEGTTTFGLQSDFDKLVSKDNWEVFQNEADIDSTKPVSLLAVADKTTKPGYTKLQIALDGVLQSGIIPNIALPPDEIQLDCKRRVVISKRYYIASMKDELHGPAFCVPAHEGYAARDMVQAFRCHSWPNSANAWFKRVAGREWPSAEMVEQMKAHGFFVVPVGHPKGVEGNIEWRISLSQQERILVRNFNYTQYKCYILLKMIKKDILAQMINGESITSYHLKTFLFYMIENTPADIWTPENLLACLLECLQCILLWSVGGQCPNYFIPEENMFDGRIHSKLLPKLQSALGKITASNFQYLLCIKSDEFGQRLGGLCTNLNYSPDMPEKKHQSELVKLAIFLRPYSSVMMIRNKILYLCSSSENDRTTRNLLSFLKKMKSLETITDHSKEETRRALSLVLPYIELATVSCAFVHKAATNYTKETLWEFLSGPKWGEIRQDSDLLSSALKMSSFMYMVGYKDYSFDVLDDLLEFLGLHVVSVCHCRKTAPLSGHPEVVLTTVEHDFDYFHSNKTAPCVVFLPAEQALVPEALVYEMYRSVGMPEGSRNELTEYWYDWAVVDGKFLHYFLLYLHHRDFKFGMEPVYIMFMELLLLDDKHLGHRDTALNLLGWIYKEKGYINKAINYFAKSLAQQKLHNAAVWHICVTINSAINRQNQDHEYFGGPYT